jgi:ferrochelatase
MTNDTHRALTPYHRAAPRTTVILVNLGTPDNPGYFSVMRYLREFLSDRRVVGLPRLLWLPILYGFILPFRSRASGQKYARIYDSKRGMPLLYHSQALCEGLQKHFADQGQAVDVVLAMRYGNPSLASVLASVRKTPVRSILVLPLFPQYSAATTATIVDKMAQLLRSWRFIPNLSFVSDYADHPRYIATLAAHIQAYWQQHGRGEKLLISFHGLPKRSVEEGDPYYCLCHKTTRLLTEKLGLAADEYELVFQSRLGPFPWLGPYTEDRITSLAQAGHKKLDIVAPGFSVDCLETVDEIGLEYEELFVESGGESLRYIPALNSSQSHIDCLAAVLADKLGLTR